MSTNEWFDRWGIYEIDGPSDDPRLGIKVYEDDLLSHGVSFGAKACLLWLRFLACHDSFSSLNKSRLADLLDVEPGTVGRWLRELADNGLLRDFAGTWADVESEGYVYFIQAVHGGPIKIGTGTDPQRRLTQLQTGHPAQLQILAIVKGGVKLERELHDRFASVRIHGEWFEPCDDLLGLVEDIGQIRSTM